MRAIQPTLIEVPDELHGQRFGLFGHSAGGQFVHRMLSFGFRDCVAVAVSANAGTEYLADGITETLIRNLAQLTKLRVTSRNSAFRYKNRDADARAIGRELKVASLLLGRLAESDDLLSISVELVDTIDDRHLWGAQYIRNRDDLFTAQETIAREIAEKLRIQISSPQKQLLAKRHTENSEAYLLFLKGRFHFNKLTLDGVQKGAEYFRKAVELDANYALGLCRSR